MKENKDKTLKSILNPVLIFAVMISLLGFISDLKHTFTYGGVDLRNRVVGARLLMEGLDPYYFKWSEDKSELLLDPADNPNSPVNRVSVPPTVLIMHSTIARLPYAIQRIVWLILQWVLLLLSLAIFAKNTSSKHKSAIIWIIGLLFISGSYFWRLHVERGQIYILYVFLISLAYWQSLKPFKYSSILSGFLIGLTASLRPPMIFMSIPMVIYKKWQLFYGNVIGVLSGIVVSVVITGISPWKKYFSAMQTQGKLHLGLINTSGPRGVTYPKNIEGMNNLSSMLWVPTDDSSIQDIFSRFLGIRLSSGILIISLAFTLLFSSFLVYKCDTKKSASMTMVFLVGVMLVFISEFFIPAARWSYNDVIWLIPLSLIIINSDSFISLLNPLIILLFIGLFFSISFFRWTPGSIVISEAAIVFYIAFTTLSFLRKN